jgi:hypothetical protein
MSTFVAALPRRRKRVAPARLARAGIAAGLPAPAGRAVALTASAALLAVEVVVSVSMWLPIPFAWLWIGGQVYNVTGSLAADGFTALLGFTASIVLAMHGLLRLDGTWIALRRRAGHDQKEGALTRIVIASATFGLIGFFIWYYALSHAYVIPFMPSR